MIDDAGCLADSAALGAVDFVEIAAVGILLLGHLGLEGGIGVAVRHGRRFFCAVVGRCRAGA